MNPALLLFITWAVMLTGFLVATDPLWQVLAWIALVTLISCGLLCWLGKR